MNLIKLEEVNSKIITVRDAKVILDSDVAVLYGVETRDINKAVRNNPDKFPQGYVFELQSIEKQQVVENFHHLEKLKFYPQNPKAFTEKGLYMLATILKSSQATQTTVAIIEAFTKMHAMSIAIVELMKDHENEQKQKTFVQKGEELFDDIIGNAFDTVDAETSFELNLTAFKIKHTVKRSKNVKKQSNSKL